MRYTEEIVCSCNWVTVSDVEEFVSLYPDMPTDQARIALNIGVRCTCCLMKDCPIIDQHFLDVIEKVKQQ